MIVTFRYQLNRLSLPPPSPGTRQSLEASIDRDIQLYRGLTYAPGTQATYRCHRRAYLKFCSSLGYSPIPATPELIQRYTAFLARSLKFTSIKQYLNIIRLMHLEWELPNPLPDFKIQSTMRGIRRALEDAVTKKLPITPAILRHILSQLNMSSCSDANVWAACLALFFGFLRKASVLPPSHTSSRTTPLPRRSDVIFASHGATIIIRHTKTIQCQQRVIPVLLPRQLDNALCPTQALFHAMSFAPQLGATSPVFIMDTKGTPISGPFFVRRIRQCLESARIPNHLQFSGHSFRRGVACFAYEIGLDTPTIKALGDWRSSAYMGYIDISNSTKLQAVQKILCHCSAAQSPHLS